MTNKELEANTTLSHYRIISKLGVGGMGEVYLAQDINLARNVAIKLLADEFNKDPNRLHRFIQEARAASALNHPNILTIHEVGETAGKHYIATEFIEGETLRHCIQHQTLKTRDALDVIVQIASALAAAHQAGIIHRDIKPENVMLRPDGFAKVLDFGLAKLTEMRATDCGVRNEEDKTLLQSTSANPQSSIRNPQSTDPGTIMGTVQYMSPEQARGKTVDARTDVFSLGIVLYETIAGRAPFAGESSTDVLAAILEKEPLPLARFAPEASAELQRIVNKSLRKKPDERYQTMRDLLLDLKELRDELALEDKLERSIRPTGVSSENQRTLIADAEVTQDVGIRTSAAASVQTTSSAEYLVNQIRQHKRRAVIGLLILLLSAAGLGYWLFAARSATGKPIDSIAVLPFDNRSADPNTEYLSDGLTESLIYRLSRLPNLKVSPTSSVFRYKGQEKDAEKIANELGVSAVMTGRIAQRSDNLTISVELVDVRNNKLLWGEQYERKLTELLATQKEIATEITQNLKLKLSGEGEKALTKRFTDNNEAYQLYLKGRFYWNKRTPENIRKAIEQFKAAADKDPNFSLAHVGLADSHVILLYYTRRPDSELLPSARAYATRALEIDDSLAEAHASLGIINHLLWNWAESEDEFKRAIELNPNYPTARHWYSRYLRTLGRFDEAMSQIKQAHEADSLSLVISDNLAENLIEHGDVNGAIEQCKRGNELDPNYWAAYRTLSSALLKLGRHDEALTQAQKAVELLNRATVSLRSWGYVQAVSGKRNEALAVAKELEERQEKGDADGLDIAVVYAGLGEKDRVFKWLEKEFQARTSSLVEIRLETAFDSLRNDPRFKDLLRRMSLPQ